MTLRLYLRRSRNDGGHQEFSLITQREGARRFVDERLSHGDDAASWDKRVEYIDDNRAGDDFEGREQLKALLADVRPGDIVVCRDHSRIGRDSLAYARWLRDLIQQRGARLFYYSTGEEVSFAGAVDALVAVASGTGAQMELEAIRSRTKEAIRARVREGKSGGGICFGYRNVREKDSAGREYTRVEIHPDEAKVVRRIFDLYLAGTGYSGIAKTLNSEAIAPPAAGRRGSGTWTPGCIREMLRRARYRGVYVHGKTNRKRVGGTRKAELAEPGEVLQIDMPEWQIIDDATWFAVQDELKARAPQKAAGGQGRPSGAPAAKYALSGLGRCRKCGHGIGVHRTKVAGGERVPAYTCTGYQKKGKAVCDVNLRQPMQEGRRRAGDVPARASSDAYACCETRRRDGRAPRAASGHALARDRNGRGAA